MEDARFVRFVDESGPVYRATYTAYDGRHIATRALASSDLRRFEITPMRGPGARNKGIALFPRTVGGRHLALCRSDGETIGLTRLDGENRWQAPVPLHAPRRSWELIQVGNCGSPIETDAGWLVLTHGVGPMRRYAIGALLLDLHRPERVVARPARRAPGTRRGRNATATCPTSSTPAAGSSTPASCGCRTGPATPGSVSPPCRWPP